MLPFRLRVPSGPAPGSRRLQHGERVAQRPAIRRELGNPDEREQLENGSFQVSLYSASPTANGVGG
jgi:hypothetical protein